MSTRVEWTPGWVLHRRRYKDSGLLLDVLSRDHGRVRLVSRGARGALAARLQVFQPLSLSWTRRGELGTLTGCETTAPALALTGMALWSGFYVNELLMNLATTEDDAEPVYRLYGEVLQALAGTRSMAVALRRFEYQLLDLLGYGFDAGAQADGGLVEAQGRYSWQRGCGLVPDARGVPGEALLALAGGSADDSVDAARPVLRAALDEVLDGRPLRTAAMLRQLGMLRRHDQDDAGDRH